jgi:hypothetical protein
MIRTREPSTMSPLTRTPRPSAVAPWTARMYPSPGAASPSDGRHHADRELEPGVVEVAAELAEVMLVHRQRRHAVELGDRLRVGRPGDHAVVAERPPAAGDDGLDLERAGEREGHGGAAEHLAVHVLLGPGEGEAVGSDAADDRGARAEHRLDPREQRGAVEHDTVDEQDDQRRADGRQGGAELPPDGGRVVVFVARVDDRRHQIAEHQAHRGHRARGRLLAVDLGAARAPDHPDLRREALVEAGQHLSRVILRRAEEQEDVRLGPQGCPDLGAMSLPTCRELLP